MSNRNDRNDRKDREPRSHRDRIRRGDTRTRRAPRGFEQPQDNRNQERRGYGRGRGADADGNIYQQRNDDRRGGPQRGDRPRGYGRPQQDDRRGPPREQHQDGGFRGPRNDDRRGGPQRGDRRGRYGRPQQDDRRGPPREQHQDGGFRGPRNDDRRGGPQRGDRPRGYGRPQQDDRRGPPREQRQGGGFRGPRNDDRRGGPQRGDRRGGYGRPQQDDRRGPPREQRQDGGFRGPRNDDRRGGPQRGDRPRGYGRRQQDDRRGPPREQRQDGGFRGPRNDDRRGGPQRGDRRGGYGRPQQDDRRGPPREQRQGGGFRGPRNDDRRGGPQRGDRRGGYGRPQQDDRRGPPREQRHERSRRSERAEDRKALRPRDNARDVAALAVMRVIEDDAFSNMALRAAFRETPMDRRDRAFTTRLTYGTLTWIGYIDAALNALLPRGLASLPPEVAGHLRIAMFQLLKDRDHTPVHAAIDGCVELVGKDSPHLRGLANGVLRNFERGRHDILEKVHETYHVESRYGLSQPIADTLLNRVSKEQARGIMEQWNAPTPVIIRSRTKERDMLSARLNDQAGILTTPHPLAPDALFYEGDIRTILRDEPEASIQDAGAQLATSTLPSDLQGLVADACAGLGGKSLHLLDLHPDIDLVAADIDPRKLRRFNAGDEEDRLTRIDGDMATMEGAEKLAVHAASSGHEDGYEAIFIDAPCSALGTLGRHPEVRWKRCREDIEELSRVQHKLLRTMAKLVRPGGYLVYVVCTFSEEETLTQVDRFMQANPDYILSPPTADTADPRVDWEALVDETQTISLWPEPHRTDGFFIARFKRKDDAHDDSNEDVSDEA